LNHTATHCNTLQHTATHCNTLQHTATHRVWRQCLAPSLECLACPVSRICLECETDMSRVSHIKCLTCFGTVSCMSCLASLTSSVRHICLECLTSSVLHVAGQCLAYLDSRLSHRVSCCFETVSCLESLLCETHRYVSRVSCLTSSVSHRVSYMLRDSVLQFRDKSVSSCNTLQHTATHCNTLQHTAAHCTTLHHTATLGVSTHVPRNGTPTRHTRPSVTSHTS